MLTLKRKQTQRKIEQKEKTLLHVSYSTLADFSFKGKEMYSKVLDVYDGNTLSLTIKVDGTYHKIQCRLCGIDKPDIHSPNDMEQNAALHARNHLIYLLTGQRIRLETSQKEIQNICRVVNSIVFVRCQDFDKYKKLLVEVEKNDINISGKMIIDGYAGIYNGTRTCSWRDWYHPVTGCGAVYSLTRKQEPDMNIDVSNNKDNHDNGNGKDSTNIPSSKHW
jgi:endonuclease YncB( thermonuclease family)